MKQIQHENDLMTPLFPFSTRELREANAAPIKLPINFGLTCAGLAVLIAPVASSVICLLKILRGKLALAKRGVSLAFLFYGIFTTSTFATIITFDDLDMMSGGIPVPNPYNGLLWANFLPLPTRLMPSPSGYTAALLSGDTIVFNGNANGIAGPASIRSGLFNLNAGYFASAWRDNLQLQAEGFLNGSLIYSNTYTLSCTSGTMIQFGYQNVDTVVFSASGGTPHSGFVANSGAPAFAMDNLDVTILHAVLISSQPVNYSCSAGDPASFSVSAYGVPPFSYQWLFNGTNIENATNSTLALTNVQSWNEGTYSVIVSSLFDSITSSNATLTVTTSPPRIITQPAIQVDPAIFNASIFASVIGSEPISYQWQNNGTNIDGATNNLIMLTNVLSLGVGYYDMIASNACGAVTSSIVSLFPDLLTSVVGWGSSNDDSGNFAGEATPPFGLSYAKAISAGGDHSLALNFDGTIAAWGDNGYGQSTVPPGLSNVVGIAAGYYHSLALKNDGTVVAWGSNISGETNVPTGLSNVVAVAAGGCDCSPNGDQSLALKSDGTVVGWGATTVPGGLSNVVAISAGDNHALALMRDGTITGWGFNYNGQATPPAGLTNVVAISAGGYHSMALCFDGKVTAWGNNYYGQTNVPADLSNVVAIAAGENFSAALRNDGVVIAWGSDIAGESIVPTGLTNIIAIATGARHVLALQNDGTPVIFRQPIGWTFYTGSISNLILNAGVVGPWPLSLQWQRDGTNIVGATNSYLIFSNVQPEDSGIYRLVASNPNTGATASSNAVLEVIGSKPIILNQPTNSFGLFGGYATISVSATGSLPIAYQWQFNGTDIIGGTNMVLNLTNLNWTNTGIYTLAASNSYGMVTTSNIYFTVIAGDLPTALNTTGLTWTSSGNSKWFPETTVTHDGVDAAQSGAVGIGGSSLLQTTVTGPGILTFWWMFSPSASPSNTLSFSSSQGNNSATVYSTSGWQQKTFYLGGGQQILHWTYFCANRRVPSTGWVDQISFTPFGLSISPTDLFMSTNGFQLQLNGVSTTNPVVIFTSTNLVSWLPLFTNPATTGSIQYLDVTATNIPTRFYRAQE